MNLAPADRRKGGSGYVLPLAIGLLAAIKIVPIERIDGWFMVGELSLTVGLNLISEVFLIALLARQEKVKGIIVALENKAEVSVVNGLLAYRAKSLHEVIDFLLGKISIDVGRPKRATFFKLSDATISCKESYWNCCCCVHNLLFIGPPGREKRMLVKRIPTILSNFDFEEALEVIKIL